ncbi:MAG: xanthine dehydrogenase family protein subunit M [Rhizobiaceae bacterium]|nr:xanthine dehydrogenase family protein subunit M [Rhizobiaceae bacterium]
MPRYAKPTTVNEALALLAQTSWRPLAGATDFYPAQGNKPITDNVLDLNALDQLRGITTTDTHIVIGARTTWTEIVRAKLPAAFDALKQAAREVGSVQIQNVATVAGNLCNASPAADGVPPLLVLDADVELRSQRGTRHVPLGDFIVGNRQTLRRNEELLTAIRVPKASVAGVSSFQKLGARRYLVISIAMAAVRLEVSDHTIRKAAIAVGACSAVAQRLFTLESELGGQDISRANGIVAGAAMPELSPIDDVRASSEYRLDAAREIVSRAIEQAISSERSVR